MTIIIKELKPELLQSHEVDFGTSIAQSLWQKVSNYQNWTNSNIPVGYLLFFYGAQTYPGGAFIEGPNLSLWALCDGSMINDPDSPLDGQPTPNLNEVYLKGGTTQGVTGGSKTVNIQHSHGGQLQTENDESGRTNARLGGDYKAGSPHFHVVPNSWSSVESIIPPTTELQIYIRKK